MFNQHFARKESPCSSIGTAHRFASDISFAADADDNGTSSQILGKKKPD